MKWWQLRLSEIIPWARLRGWLLASPTTSASVAIPECAAIPAPKVPVKARQKGQTPGEFYFREAILDRLDDYFDVLRRMKRSDPRAWRDYRKWGGIVVPEIFRREDVDGSGAFSEWFLRNRPSFGMMFWHHHRDDLENVCPRAISFTKYKAASAPLGIERAAGGDVYVVTLHFDENHDDEFRKRMGGSFSTDFPMHLAADGTLRLLRARWQTRQTVKGKRGRFSLPVERWGVSPMYVDWAQEQGISPEDLLTRLFQFCANELELSALSATTVRIKRGHLAATFSVNVERTAYFFRDRDVTLGDAGSRRRIFHIVRPHMRKMADGREVGVRAHFRGERKFVWNGYGVEITVPGWHHADVRDFNVAAHDSEAAPEMESDSLIEAPEWLLDLQKSGAGAHERYRQSSLQ